jgi:hypothetical protein
MNVEKGITTGTRDAGERTLSPQAREVWAQGQAAETLALNIEASGGDATGVRRAATNIGEAAIALSENERRVGEARRVMTPHLGSKSFIGSMTTEEVRTERQALHVSMAPLLRNYIDAAEGAPKLAALNAMGDDLPRYHALGNELATRVSAELREARIARESEPQLGFGY